MATFLLKTEPGTYSFADLVREKRTVWSGVSNPAALIALRSMRKGDEAFIYHTGDEKAVVGLARVVSDAYEDPERPGVNKEGLPKFAVVDLAPVRAAKTVISLGEMRENARFKDFELLRPSRLSVMPVPSPIDKLIRKLTGIGA